jgi:Zn-dependent oligopeptidase
MAFLFRERHILFARRPRTIAALWTPYFARSSRRSPAIHKASRKMKTRQHKFESFTLKVLAALINFNLSNGNLPP